MIADLQPLIARYFAVVYFATVIFFFKKGYAKYLLKYMS